MRMASLLRPGQILLGRTGVPYQLQKVLYERVDNDGGVKIVKNGIWLASSKETPYVIKPVTRPFYEQAFELRPELSFTPYIRLPIDGIEDGMDDHMGLVFHFYTDNFLQLVHNGGFSRTQVKRILLDVLKGIAACHSKDWVHCDVKPNNVMVSYKTLNPDVREIESVALIDMECAAKLNEGQAIYGQVGNVLWRSPEAQAGICVGKPSDIWSFGATALYGITRLVVFAYGELEEGVPAEVEVLSNQISYFGPVPKGLLELMGDSVWAQVLLTLNNGFDKDYPARPFHLWKNVKGLEPSDKVFFLRVMKLDPEERPTAEKLLEDPCDSSSTPLQSTATLSRTAQMTTPAKLLASQLIKNSSKAGVTLAIEYATKTTAWNRTFCSPELQADFAAVAEEAKFNSDILDDTIKVTMKW
ncbi:MAG: hypothetical protein L6R42_008921, partial [Xanthoria sp. 1 TBL-2021]